MSIRAEAEKCAAELPTGFALLGFLTLIEIVYYSFMLWKNCHTSSAPNSPVKTECTLAVPSGTADRQANRRYRKAKRCTEVSAHRQNVTLSPEDLDTLTTHKLLYVGRMSSDTLTSCMAESPYGSNSSTDEDGYRPWDHPEAQ